MREPSLLRPSASAVLIMIFVLHSAQGHFFSQDSAFPSNYATLYSNQYGMAYQQIWDEPHVGVVQVHPPTFHGKYFQQHLLPLWAQHVGLATAEAPLYSAEAAVPLVPLAPVPVAPYTYTSTYPLATAPGAGTAVLAHPTVITPAMPVETGTQATDAAATGEDKMALTTDAPKEGDDGSQTEATPTDSKGMAAPIANAPGGGSEGDDVEPTVDSGASNNSPSFLGAPENSTPVTVTVPEADGKRVVIYQFPNLLEGLVQRFQNYFSTYNHITTHSVANAVANANANAVSNSVSNAASNSVSNSESNSNSNSNSNSDSKSQSASLSDSKSQSESDSNSNSLSGSNSISGSNAGKGEPQGDNDIDGDPDGTSGVQSIEKQDQVETTTPGFTTTTDMPTTSLPSITSTERHPPYLPPPPPPPYRGYPPQRPHPQKWSIDPPQRSLSYEVHITTEAPFNGYRYNRPRLPFDPYREHYVQRQRSNQWRPIPSMHWEGPRYHSGPQGRSYNYRPRFDHSHYYPRRI